MLQNKELCDKSEKEDKLKARNAVKDKLNGRLRRESQECMNILDALGVKTKLEEIRDQIWKIGVVKSDFGSHGEEWFLGCLREATPSNKYQDRDDLRKGLSLIELPTEWPNFKPFEHEHSTSDFDGWEMMPASPARIDKVSLKLSVIAYSTNSGIVIGTDTVGPPFLFDNINNSNIRVNDLLLSAITWGGKKPNFEIIHDSIKTCQDNLRRRKVGKPDWYDSVVNRFR